VGFTRTEADGEEASAAVPFTGPEDDEGGKCGAIYRV
jgi:hypothetical protein